MQINANYAPTQTYETSQAQNTGASGRTGNDYLKELRERYPNANISVGDVGPGGIENYAWGKVGKFNDVLIHPDALEKFANDPGGAAKMEAELKEFIDSEQSTKDYFDARGMTLLGRGMTVDKNGETNFWCITQTKMGDDKGSGNTLLDKLGPKQSRKELDEEAQRAREKKAEEKRIEEKRQKKSEEREELMNVSQNRMSFATGKSIDELALKLATKVGGGILDVRA